MNALSTLIIVILLGLASFFYTMAGFAGGSTFTAILLLIGISAGQSALGGLLFNVVSASSSIFRWRTHFSRGFAWFIIGSVPAAFLAGLFVLPEALLKIVMGVAITAGGVSLIVITFPLGHIVLKWPFKILIGIVIGAVAGLTGIGGGVYLAPVLILGGMAKPKTTAATTTVFILLNSLSGIVARIPRLGSLILSTPVFLLSIPVLFVSAQLGSHFGSERLSQISVKRTIGLVLISVGAYLTLSAFIH
ncbi:MAG: sulfite exporter TauE/SafE family protein [Candidatus Bathyarchaeia archaeon]